MKSARKDCVEILAIIIFTALVCWWASIEWTKTRQKASKQAGEASQAQEKPIKVYTRIVNGRWAE